MTTLASCITKEIRNASLKKNAELSAALEVTEKVSEMATDARNEWLSAHHKSFLKSKLTNARNSVRQAPLKDEVDVYYQEIAFEELDMLIGSVKGSTSFKALNSMKGLSSIEKKTLEKVFQIIIKYNADTYPEWIDFILNYYSQGDATISQKNLLLTIIVQRRFRFVEGAIFAIALDLIDILISFLQAEPSLYRSSLFL